jgi:chromosome segregation ATPase
VPRLEIRRAERLSVQEIGDQPITIGRSSGNDVALLNLHVSRKHCVIERGEDGNLRVRDLESVSGTWVNGDRVTQCTLFAGDRVSVGPYDLIIRGGPEDASLVSRNAALESAMSHVALDEDTGIPVEGPSALILNLKREIEEEQKRRADALAQVAQLHSQIEELTQQRDEAAQQRDEATRQRDDAARLNERAMLLELEDESAESGEWDVAQADAREDVAEAQPDERDQQILALQEQLAEQRERADAAEARLADLTAELESMRQSALEWQAYAESLASAAPAGRSASDGAASREVETLRASVRESEERIAALSAEVESLRAGAVSAEDARTRIATLTTEIESLRAAASSAGEAGKRIAALTAEVESLRSRADDAAAQASAADEVAGQIAELEGTIQIERGRAQAAEARATELAARLEEASRLAQAAEQADELQRLIEIERNRVDSASTRLGELESQLAQVSQERADDLERIAGLTAALENAQRLLAEAQSSAEVTEAERRTAAGQLEEAQAELARWRAQADDNVRALETERAHAADLNRALEEAWHKIEEMAEGLRAMESRVEEMEAASVQAGERAAEALAQHLAEIERLTSTEAGLRNEVERMRQPDAAPASVAELQSQLETARNSLHHALARADELEQAAADLRARIEELEERLRTADERHEAALSVKDRHIHDLRSTGEQLRQRLNNLEATKYAASEKAERALRTLNVLQGQIRSLDDATSKVSALQDRLAQVEAAWVQTDESLETTTGDNQEELQLVVQQRQQLGQELELLNKARDAAVASLRDSALRLRSLAERETPVLTTGASATATAPKTQDPGEPAGQKVGAGRKWWKFGG